MITIDSKSRLPFYEQLVENIRALVLSGALEGDAQLPSVRQLAGELGINPNTVQKAYATLQQTGVIYTVPGRGNFICSDTTALRADRGESLLEQLRQLVLQLRRLGIGQERVAACVQEVYKEEQGQ